METHLSHPDFDDLKKRVEALEKKRSCTPHNLMETIEPDTNDPSQFPADGNDVLNYK